MFLQQFREYCRNISLSNIWSDAILIKPVFRPASDCDNELQLAFRPQELIQNSQQIVNTGAPTDAAFVSRRRVVSSRLPPWFRVPPPNSAVSGCLPEAPDSLNQLPVATVRQIAVTRPTADQPALMPNRVPNPPPFPELLLLSDPTDPLHCFLSFSREGEGRGEGGAVKIAGN